MLEACGRIEIEGCDTIPKLFWHQVKARDGRTAFREKDLGIWRATSWRDYGQRARWTGMGLAKLGLARGEVVSILADTCARLMEKEDIKEFYLGIKDQGARGQRRWKKRKTWR